MILLLACGWAGLVTWLIARAVGQSRLFPALCPTASLPLDPGAFVTVVVPARDEEHNIGACLEALLRQSYPRSQWRVVVVDDHSRDATHALACAIAQQHGGMEVLQSPPLPRGWVGKCHACWIGAAAAPAQTRWLCFLDADVRAEPDLIAHAVAVAEADGLDLLSLLPRQQLGSFAERLVMPCGLYIMSICQNLAELQSPRSRDATVTGQFILARRDKYLAVGGHAAVRADIAEDVALGRTLKRAGGRVELRDGAALLRARMYAGWGSLWEGVTKNLVDMLGGPARTLATAVLAPAGAWATLVLPGLCAVAVAEEARGALPALAIAAAASLSLIGLHIGGARHFRIPFWYGLLFPLGYTVGAVMALDSVLRRRRGRVVWKGRTYA
jgi:chlorobactene glucosyltransferase